MGWLGVAAALACTGAVCGPDPGTRPPEVPADTAEGRIVQNANRSLRATGVTIDTTKLGVEDKRRDEIAGDLGARLEMGLRSDHLDMLWRLRGVLESTPPVRSLKTLRTMAVDERVPSARVYYAIDRKAIVFVEADQQETRAVEAAAAGQLVYAYYDQGPGGLSEALYEPEGKLDGIRVRQCLLEGHARLAEALVQHSTLDNLDADALAELDPSPLPLHATLSEAPCGPGTLFLLQRYRAEGWPAVLRAVRTPPPSSEQLMHPAKLDQDFPVNVSLPGWPEDEFEDPDPIGEATLVHEDVLGELTIHRLLLERGVEPPKAIEAAVGWDGDRIRIYDHGSGKVIVWRSVWDREIDAQQFAAAIAPKGIEPRAFRVQRHGRVVDAVSTTGPELAERVHAVLAERTGEPAAQPADAASTASIEAQLPG